MLSSQTKSRRITPLSMKQGDGGRMGEGKQKSMGDAYDSKEKERSSFSIVSRSTVSILV